MTESQELDSIRKSVAQDYELDEPNSQRAIDEAIKDGLSVIYPADNELQLDIDTEHAMHIFGEMQPLLERYFGVIGLKITPSRSGGVKKHVTITLRENVDNRYHRIALQLALGSDRVREMLSIVQEHNQDPHPTLFLEKHS